MSTYEGEHTIFGLMKKNEMLSFAGKWMELENIILSEVSLAQEFIFTVASGILKSKML
jgi:hypothetical protein